MSERLTHAGSIYNRLKRPIAVIGSLEAYVHLCRHCNLDPNSNDVFFHCQYVWDCGNREFSRVVDVGDKGKVPDYLRVLSVAKSRIRN